MQMLRGSVTRLSLPTVRHLQIALGRQKPEVVYVRSDGYIGLRTESLDGHPLLRYLRLINRI
jgi:hypothetical protein